MADVLAVFDRECEIEQHQVGRGGENIARDMLKRFAGLDFKPGAGKDVDKLTTNGLVVFNDINQRHGFRSPLGCLATIMAAKLQVRTARGTKVTELFASGGVLSASHSQRRRGPK